MKTMSFSNFFSEIIDEIRNLCCTIKFFVIHILKEKFESKNKKRQTILGKNPYLARNKLYYRINAFLEKVILAQFFFLPLLFFSN